MEVIKNKFLKLDNKKKFGVIIGIVIVLYLLISLFFQSHYFPGTEINGYSCGFRSVKKVKKKVGKSIEDYKIKLIERDGKKETITSEQVGLKFVDDGRLEEIKDNQKGYAWIVALFQGNDYPDGMTFQVDETSYQNTFNSLNAFDEKQVVAPVDAFSQYDEATNSYRIVD